MDNVDFNHPAPDRRDFLAGMTALAGGGDPSFMYFRRGHGHTLKCLRNEPCHFILVVDNGSFTEFGTPAATFDALPKRDVFITGG